METDDKQLDSNFQNEKFINNNREHLMTNLDPIIYCAKQEIPLPANDESGPSRNRGNYLELLELIARYDSDVAR